MAGIAAAFDDRIARARSALTGADLAAAIRAINDERRLALRAAAERRAITDKAQRPPPKGDAKDHEPEL